MKYNYLSVSAIIKAQNMSFGIEVNVIIEINVKL